MTVMRVVQMAINQVIYMVSMRDRGMATLWPMHMVFGVAAKFLLKHHPEQSDVLHRAAFVL